MSNLKILKKGIIFIIANYTLTAQSAYEISNRYIGNTGGYANRKNKTRILIRL